LPPHPPRSRHRRRPPPYDQFMEDCAGRNLPTNSANYAQLRHRPCPRMPHPGHGRERRESRDARAFWMFSLTEPTRQGCQTVKTSRETDGMA
jgi:hypothetical protein